jgi:hypothetical protein
MKTAGQKPTPKPSPPVGSNGKSTKKHGGVTGRGFMPGKSGNPSGRSPRVANFSKEVRLFLRERDLKRKDGEARLLTLLERLLRDDPKQLLYYAYGKPMDTVQLQGADDGTVTVKWFLDPEVVTGPAPEKLLETKKNEA